MERIEIYARCWRCDRALKTKEQRAEARLIFVHKTIGFQWEWVGRCCLKPEEITEA